MLATPAALLLLGLLPVVWLLHRRRQVLRFIAVPSLHLLPEERTDDPAAKGPPLDRWLLLLRLVLVGLGVLALAGPSLPGAGGGRLVLVVDLSASMAAPDQHDPSQSRLEAARQRAAAAAVARSPDWVLVLGAGARPVAAGGWRPAAEVGDALSSLAPEQGPADLALALAEARSLAGQVRVFTDDGAPIPGNRALTTLSFRPHLHATERGWFLVSVRRGPAGVEEGDDTFVRIDLGGKQVGTVRLAVPPGGRGSAVLEYRGPGGAPAKARLLGEDPLPADDTAAVEVPRLTRRRIVLVTPGNPELERALRAWPRGEVRTSPPGHHPSAPLLVLDREGRAAPDRAAVFVRPGGEGRSGRVVPVPAPDPGRPGLAAAAALTLESWEALPPPPPGARVLLTASGAAGDPLMWLRSAPRPPRAALAFDPGAAGLAGSPLHAILWADLLQDLLLPEDGGCTRVEVGTPTEEGPLVRPGLYRLEDRCLIASVPESESFPEPSDPAAAAGPEVAAPRRAAAGWLAAAAALLLLLEALLAMRGRGIRRGPLLLQLGALAALVVAVAGPACPGEETHTVVVAVDGSASVPRAARAAAATRADAWRDRLDEATGVRGLVFGGAPREVGLGELPAAARQGEGGGTDLVRALDAAGRLAGPGGAVVLLTDGRHRGAGDPRQVAAGLRQGGVTVHVAPVWSGERDAWVDAVTVPPGVRQGGSAPVTVVLRAVGGPAEGTLVLSRDGEEVARLPAAVPAGGASTRTVTLPFPEAGRREVRATLAGVLGQETSDNDEGGVLVDVAGPARVLRIGGADGGDLLAPVLAGAGHALEQVAPGELALDAARLAAYDLVVVDDVPLAALPRGADAALEAYASAGGGVLVLGGRRSFGPGGWAGSALDAAAPLQADPRRAGGRLASVLVLDKSGSMAGAEGGWERLLLGKATVRSLLRTFRHAEDRVGVLGYDTGPVVVLPMTRVADVRPEFVDTGGLHPAGGTDPVPALREAERWLGPAGRFPMRHVVLVSDGRFPGKGAEAAVEGLLDKGIRVSAVGVGTAADAARLQRLAAAGGGSFTPVTDLADLPSVVAKQLLAASGRPVREEVVKVEHGPALLGLVPEAPGPVPPLRGLVATSLRQDAHLWLVAESGEPVLAGSRHGAGRTAALATDLHGEWTAAWAGWEGTARLLGAVVAWTTRRRDGPWETTVSEAAGGALRADLDAVDGAGRPVAGLTPRAVADRPGGGRVEARMEPVAPGRYRATLPPAGRGAVFVTVMAEGGAMARAGLLHLAPAELRDRGDDEGALAALAAAGGGQVLGPGRPLPPPPGRRAPEQPARGLALLAGLALFLAYVWREGRLSRAAQE